MHKLGITNIFPVGGKSSSLARSRFTIGTSMNPQEFVRVKQRLQLFHGAPKQVTFAPDGKANMIAERLYPINVFRSNRQDFVIGFHD
jgi:hypothetical protein